MKTLSNKRLYYLLLLLNGIVAIITFTIANNTIFPDGKGYELMAESIGHGKFSSWYFLPFYVPETLRMWGYPFFIYLVSLVNKSELFFKLVQLVLYFCTVFITLGIIKYKNNTIIYRNLFLLLLLPNNQIVYYSGLIASENLATFLTVSFIYVYITKKLNWKNAVLLAIIAFADYQTRPIFIVFPFMLFAYDLFFKFNMYRLKNSILCLCIYTILFLPFGYWNLKNHGIFKITPLEGGAGPAQMGYWDFKLPDGYKDKYYIKNKVIDDYFQPSFFDSIQKVKFTKDYDNEWHEINEQLANYNTHEDTEKLLIMKQNNPGIFILHNSAYTNEREKLIQKYTERDIIQTPMYYLETRVYTFCREWYAGINKSALKKSHSLRQTIMISYPFLVSFTFVFLGLLFVSVALISKKMKWKEYDSLYLLIMYFGITNVPFSIQSRYTIPVQLLVIALLAISIVSFLKSREKLPPSRS